MLWALLGYRWCCLRKLAQCSTEVAEDTVDAGWLELMASESSTLKGLCVGG